MKVKRTNTTGRRQIVYALFNTSSVSDKSHKVTTDHHHLGQEPRPVEVSAHQKQYEGFFHGWTQIDSGHMKAVVEKENGHVVFEEPYLLKFPHKPVLEFTRVDNRW